MEFDEIAKLAKPYRYGEVVRLVDMILGRYLDYSEVTIGRKPAEENEKITGRERKLTRIMVIGRCLIKEKKMDVKRLEK